MNTIEQAKSLIDQGRIKEAQSILKEIIYSNPHDMAAWELYVKTMDSDLKRTWVLESCLRLNPGDPEVTRTIAVLNERLNKLPSAKLVETVTANSGWQNPFFDLEVNERSKRPIPDIHIPENEEVLSYLKKDNSHREEIVHFDYRLVKTEDPNISDITDNFLRQTEKLPQQCQYIIYGYPAAIHPESRIIFGFSKGSDIYYCLPAQTAEAVNEHFENVFAEAAGTKPARTKTRSKPLPFGKNWTNFGSYFTNSLIQKCYSYNGGLQNQSVNLIVQDDLLKLFPTRSERLMGQVMNLLIVVLIIVLAVILYYFYLMFR